MAKNPRADKTYIGIFTILISLRVRGLHQESSVCRVNILVANRHYLAFFKCLVATDKRICLPDEQCSISSGNNVQYSLLKAIPPGLLIKGASRYYTLVQIDLLLQDFENLSFYEKRGQINMQYIYEQFAYYITALWKNGYIQQYIEMTRQQPNLKNAYSNFEKLNNTMVIRLQKDSIAAEKEKKK